jgi:hypothetical protein
MTRRLELRKKDDIVRRCRHCGITNDDIPFLVQKDTKSGRFYTHSVCRACWEEERKEYRSGHYMVNRVREIEVARRWNVENRERYNERRRKPARWYSKI